MLNFRLKSYHINFVVLSTMSKVPHLNNVTLSFNSHSCKHITCGTSSVLVLILQCSTMNYDLRHCTPNSNSSKNSFTVFWVLHSWLTLPLPSLTTLLLYEIHRYLFIYSLPLTLTISTHNFPQPGQKLSCRPRSISMLSIKATLSISNHNLLFFLLLAQSYHHPTVSDCLAKVWMIDRLLFHLVKFYLILNTEWGKNSFQIRFLKRLFLICLNIWWG